MKIRTDFVTNSSSSSFIICKDDLTGRQLSAIQNHRELSKRLKLENYQYDDWRIDESEHYISGYTGMDNFMFDDFFKKIGVPNNKVTWDEYSFDLEEQEAEYKILDEWESNYYED